MTALMGRILGKKTASRVEAPKYSQTSCVRLLNRCEGCGKRERWRELWRGDNMDTQHGHMNMPIDNIPMGPYEKLSESRRSTMKKRRRYEGDALQNDRVCVYVVRQLKPM